MYCINCLSDSKITIQHADQNVAVNDYTTLGARIALHRRKLEGYRLQVLFEGIKKDTFAVLHHPMTPEKGCDAAK